MYLVKSLDLHNICFYVTIKRTHTKYLRFCVGSKHYHFKVLQLGPSTSPQVFTKCFAVAAVHLRHQDVFGYLYFDDWSLRAKSHQNLTWAIQYMYNLF